MNKNVKVSTFNELISVIRKEIEDGRIILEQDANTRKTTVMWRIGSHIHTHILEHSEKADYGEYLFDNLSKELGLNKRTLYRTVKFYKEYPEIVTALSRFTWTHYLILQTIKDNGKRLEYEKLIEKENLSTRELQELVKKERNQLPSKILAELKIKRGRPGVYRLKEMDGILNIDIGFYDYIERQELINIDNPDAYIEYTDPVSYKFIEPDKSILYTFKAKIIEVVDGDTVKAKLYRGFGIKTLRTLRFRGINAQDLMTEQGRKAKEYIEAKVLNLPFIVIKTYSRDIYLRYLADVFYLPDNEDVYTVAEKGKYLNQELIDAGLAERYWRW